MKKKMILSFALVLAISLLFSSLALAQDEEERLVPFEVRNKTDQTVFIVLTTSGLPTDTAAEGETATLSVPAGLGTAGQRLAALVGSETGALNFVGIAVGPEETRTFTVRPDVYFTRITACGTTQDGVADVRRYLRLVFVPCDSSPANLGAPSIEKVSFPEPEDAPNMWYHHWAIPD